jgi:uncharacterized protein
MEVTRRKFLKHTLGATAAYGLARLGTANDKVSTPELITDTHAYLGHWPHQQLSSDDPANLVANLRHAGVTQAWTGSFDGLFHKNIAGVNQRLADTCARVGDGMLIPFGTVNPTLPDWKEDIRRCHKTFHMPGIRLHPNYHGYTLDDPRFAKLLELAAARGLVVQLVAWMEAERHLLLNPHEPEVDVKPLADKIAPLPRLSLVLTNYDHSSHDESIRELLKNKHVYFDFTRASNAEEIAQLIVRTSSERVVFGSCAPLHNVELSVSKLNEMKLSPDVRRKISSANAASLLALTRKTSAAVTGNRAHAIVSTQ